MIYKINNKKRNAQLRNLGLSKSSEKILYTLFILIKCMVNSPLRGLAERMKNEREKAPDQVGVTIARSGSPKVYDYFSSSLT